MAYQDLYIRRRPAAPAPEPAPRPSGESFVDFQRRLHPPNIDASAGLNEAERRTVKEIQRLMASGQWGVGNIVPHRLMAAVFDGCAPQSAPSLLEASSDPKASIARQINAGTSLRASLATDTPVSRRNLATDGPQHRPTMSYRLQQVMGDYDLLDEDSFDESMRQWGVTEPRDRIGLKTEAMHLGLMRARGTPLPAPPQARKYRPIPGVDDPTHQRAIDRNSKAADKSTAGNPRTIQACTAEGFCAYDGTGIEFL